MSQNIFEMHKHFYLKKNTVDNKKLRRQRGRPLNLIL